MNLTTWLLERHPFFVALREHLLSTLSWAKVESLDQLVVLSRRPVRTVLLMTAHLVHKGDIQIGSNGSIVSTRAPNVMMQPRVRQEWWENERLSHLQEQYLRLVSHREDPVLLWSQRRLVPSSAIERAQYLLQCMKSPHGSIVFLGDDDAVSPLVAATAPGWSVHVVDIDRAVLDFTEHVSAQLGAGLKTTHTDLSVPAPDHLGTQVCDIVVCDPFPSGDGSFEAMFWHQAARLLRSDALLVTTIAPSHKPLGYSMGALSQLHRMGYCLQDIRADFGRYEVFDFEWIAREREILARLGLNSTISHTKSLLTASRLEPLVIANEGDLPGFDFPKWTYSATTHYLTIQAGQDRQVQLAKARGAQGHFDSEGGSKAQRGLRIDMLISQENRATLLGATISPTKMVSTLCSYLEAADDLRVEDDEREELIRLATSTELSNEGNLAQLGLAIRAIESWGRWRFDV